MRIVFVNWNRRREGGVETYLDTMISALHQAGHDVALCHEIDAPADRAQIRLPQEAPSWCAADLGIQQTVAAVRQWQPDLVYTHNVASIELEQQIMKIAPAVFFAHAYQGTCISGSKTFRVPKPNPCHRRFGWQCLLHFYPRRCGGLNPVTMLSLFRTQANRLALIKKYQFVLTHSEHMRTEYIRNGLPADRVISIPYCVTPLRPGSGDDSSILTGRTLSRSEWRLAFAGRMDALKGGSFLLNLMPLLRSRAGRRLHLTLAGDGPRRRDWEAVASRVQASVPDVKIEFTGWLREERLAPLFDNSDLFVMPSLWPEPFGIVGVQAGLQGLPAAAFEVGGIPTWLVDGVSGHLAPGDPPTAEGLVRAILKCLSDHDHYLDLRRGAAAMARRFTVETHMRELLTILQTALCSK
jgi:glycosyltransferase involved in cell wall biosynthesis